MRPNGKLPSGKRSTARFANGIASALIVVFFFAHGLLGAVAVLTSYFSPFTWLVWCGVAIIVAHVALSVVTSKQQLGDTQHPPSARKKRHLALKWATGALLASVAAVHIVSMRLGNAAETLSSVVGATLTVVLSIALAVHVCVGSKSLLSDLGIDRKFQPVLRIVACVIAFAISAAAIIGTIAH